MEITEIKLIISQLTFSFTDCELEMVDAPPSQNGTPTHGANMADYDYLIKFLTLGNYTPSTM